MTILIMTIPITLLLVSVFIVAFVVAVKGKQFHDLETPAHILLLEDENSKNESEKQPKTMVNNGKQ